MKQTCLVNAKEDEKGIAGLTRNDRSFRMKIKYFFVILVCLCFSCSKKVSTDEKIQVANIVFPKNINVEYVDVYTDFLLSYPKSILLSDGHIIIQDDKGHDSFFHVINIETGLLIYEFGHKGNGPEEILSTTNPYYNEAKKEVQIYDYNKRCLCYHIVGEKKIVKESILNKLKEKNLYFMQFFNLEKYYLATGMNGILNDEQFVLFDKSFELINHFVKYPILDCDNKKNKKLNKELFNIYFLKISPDMKNFVFASYKIGLLEIFSLEELPEKITKIKSLLLTEPMKNSDENIWGFEDFYVTNNFIYALHNGKTTEENPYYSKSIKVFNWRGDPIVEYYVGINMRCLAVNENENIIYAVAYDDEKGYFLIEINIPL